CVVLRYPFFLLILRPPSSSPLFPYTTLFRSPKRAVDNVVKMSFPERVDRAVRVEPRPNRPCVLERERRARAYAVMAALNGWRVRSEEHSLNSSHVKISYAVFCLKKKNKNQ